MMYELSRTDHSALWKKQKQRLDEMAVTIRLRATGAGLIPLQVAAGANTDENTKLQTHFDFHTTTLSKIKIQKNR